MYYYEFVVGGFDLDEQTFKYFEPEGLDEDGIAKLEGKIMKANQKLTYCKYIGEGFTF